MKERTANEKRKDECILIIKGLTRKKMTEYWNPKENVGDKG